MVKFIAEVSSNHNCDLKRCYKFIDKAADSGCYAIKFQLFKINKLFSREILNKSKKHRDRKNWELPSSFIPLLAERSKKRGIKFVCTPFYLEGVDVLSKYVDYFKISSYEMIWDDLLKSCARTGKPILISTGMATISEIKHAVSVLKNNGCIEPILFHCTSSYPTPFNEANLSAIKTIRSETGCEVGWSDHTAEEGVIQRSIHKWGASVIEFHLDLDKKGEEFKQGHCWLPSDIKNLIEDVKKALGSDGNGVKVPIPSELSDRNWRADPSDGLRPLKKIRKSWKP